MSVLDLLKIGWEVWETATWYYRYNWLLNAYEVSLWFPPVVDSLLWPPARIHISGHTSALVYSLPTLNWSCFWAICSKSTGVLLLRLSHKSHFSSTMASRIACPGKNQLLCHVAQTVKRLSAMQETRVRSLVWEDPLEKEMAAHSSSLARKIPWLAEPGRLPSMGSQRVRHDWATSLSLFTFMSCKHSSSSTEWPMWRTRPPANSQHWYTDYARTSSSTVRLPVNTAPAYRWPQPHRPEWQLSNQTWLSESGSLISDYVTILHVSGLYAILDNKDMTFPPPTPLTTTAFPLCTFSPHDSWTPFSASWTLRSNTTPPPDPIPPTLPFLFRTM